MSHSNELFTVIALEVAFRKLGAADRLAFARRFSAMPLAALWRYAGGK